MQDADDFDAVANIDPPIKNPVLAHRVFAIARKDIAAIAPFERIGCQSVETPVQFGEIAVPLFPPQVSWV